MVSRGRGSCSVAGMLALLLSLALVAPSVAEPATEKRRVLVLDFTAEGVDAPTTRTLTAIVATAFARDQRYLVTSGADLRAAVDVESSRQAMACADESCMADLAGALGAELVVSGSVGKLGDLLIVTISLYDAALQASAGKRKVEDRDLAALSPRLDAAVDDLLGGRAMATSSASAGSFHPLPVVALVGGGALVVLGGLAAGYGYVVSSDPASLGADKQLAAIAFPVGLVVAGVGAAGVVAGVVLPAIME